MLPHIRIARPYSDLERAVAMYQAGLGLSLLYRFEDHDGFDGVMLGWPEAAWHFEFTYCRKHPVSPSPGVEDLLVLYVPDQERFEGVVASMNAAGFLSVEPFNPYWSENGMTFADPEGYQTVLSPSKWR